MTFGWAIALLAVGSGSAFAQSSHFESFDGYASTPGAAQGWTFGFFQGSSGSASLAVGQGPDGSNALKLAAGVGSELQANWRENNLPAITGSTPVTVLRADFKLTQYTSNRAAMMMQVTTVNGGTPGLVSFDIDNGAKRALVMDGGGKHNLLNSNTLALGVWYTVVVMQSYSSPYTTTVAWGPRGGTMARSTISTTWDRSRPRRINFWSFGTVHIDNLSYTIHGAGTPSREEIVQHESAIPGIWVRPQAQYTHDEEDELTMLLTEEDSDDQPDRHRRYVSYDNGETWDDDGEPWADRAQPYGREWRYFHPRLVDGGVVITPQIRARIPHSNPDAGIAEPYWEVWYTLRRQNELDFCFDGQAIAPGQNSDEPFPGVVRGTTPAVMGDLGSAMIRTSNGRFVLPVQVLRYEQNGKRVYGAAVLFATWDPDPASCRLRWSRSPIIEPNTSLSTRGWLEPTVVEMPDQRLLMVIRGSNKDATSLPGRKWYSVSSNGGATWSTPQPWFYADNVNASFYSPSSMSRLIKHSSGRYYWIGNLVPSNPNGNGPRYPLVIGEVDPRGLGLMSSTLTTIETRTGSDSSSTMFSNFDTTEERGTGDLIIYMAPFFRINNDYTGPPYKYRVQVP